MPDSRTAVHPAPDGPDPDYEIACELLGVLPFGARAEALTVSPARERVDTAGSTGPRGRAAGRDGRSARRGGGRRGDRVGRRPGAPARAPSRAAAPASWSGTCCTCCWPPATWAGPVPDAPLSVRRVAAADLFFDATQTVLGDDDWKGPNGVEFALLTAFAARICRARPAAPCRGRIVGRRGTRPRHGAARCSGGCAACSAPAGSECLAELVPRTRRRSAVAADRPVSQRAHRPEHRGRRTRPVGSPSFLRITPGRRDGDGLWDCTGARPRRRTSAGTGSGVCWVGAEWARSTGPTTPAVTASSR